MFADGKAELSIVNRPHDVPNDYLICQPYRVSVSLLDDADEIFGYNVYRNNAQDQIDSAHKTRGPASTSEQFFLEYSSKERQLIERLGRSTSCQEALVTLEQMWRDMKFCDLILATESSEYLAHQIVFAYHSEVLRRLFRKTADEFVICVKVVVSNEKSFRKLLRYMYTNQISLTIRTVESIIECSKTFQLVDLIRLCEDFLLTLSPKYMLSGLAIAHRQKMLEIEDKCLSNAASNYHNAFNYHFAGLDPHLAATCLKEARKFDPSVDETFLFDRAVEWIDENRAIFAKDAGRLFSQIDLSRIDSNHLRLTLKKSPFLLKTPELTGLFGALMTSHKPSRLPRLSPNLADKFRKPEKKPSALAVKNLCFPDSEEPAERPKLKKRLLIGMKAKLLRAANKRSSSGLCISIPHSDVHSN